MYGAKAYKSVDLNTAVISASPHALITMLMDEAIKRMRLARIHMEERQFAEKGKCIGKAIQIIQDGLLAALNMELGGEIALRLKGIYEYITQQLVLASARNDDALIQLCIELLSEVRAGWVDIAQEG
ncbi:flagellar export chaperone FliS [Limnobacter sp.]|uniref:flagellar export chaperone FliS n=1 Tax=Limnobacter sp. TaxID=2003368 RepID=UPI0035111815